MSSKMVIAKQYFRYFYLIACLPGSPPQLSPFLTSLPTFLTMNETHAVPIRSTYQPDFYVLAHTALTTSQPDSMKGKRLYTVEAAAQAGRNQPFCFVSLTEPVPNL